MTVETKVILLALLNALLLAAGVICQKLNTVRGGHPVYGPWLIAALACFVPTFFVTNEAFRIGGRMSVYIPVTSVNFVLIALGGWILFDEPVTARSTIGFACIIGGIALVAGRA